MLGKPPTLAYQGIGYSADPSVSAPSRQRFGRKRDKTPAEDARPSTSSAFSDYDDLRDFEGRFNDSQSTINARNSLSRNRSLSEVKRPSTGVSRKPSRGFLGGILRASSPTSSELDKRDRQLPPPPPPPSAGGRRLKALRSMGSLRGKPSARDARTSDIPPKVLPPPLQLDVGLGLSGTDWMDEVRAKYSAPPATATGAATPEPVPPRGHARKRSVSLTSPRSSMLASPGIAATSTYQAALGNALIAASHAEASRGTHSDLLQILNHEGASWGFAYSAYPHRVRVWYGDRDEKIAENAVRWMERNMGDGRCLVKVVKGADHGLMYRSSVVIEALERAREVWVDARA
jgi:hypothetical protein